MLKAADHTFSYAEEVMKYKTHTFAAQDKKGDNQASGREAALAQQVQYEYCLYGVSHVTDNDDTLLLMY